MPATARAMRRSHAIPGRKEWITNHYSDETLSAFLDSDLDPARTDEIADHIRECAECRQAVAELTAIRQAAAELESSEPSNETWLRIRERTVQPVRRFGVRWVWSGAAAAAVVLLVGAFVLLRTPADGGSARTVEVSPAEVRISETREMADARLIEYRQAYVEGVEAALAEVGRALAENPRNPRVQEAYHGVQSRSLDRFVVEVDR